ncbi:hypothetical protein BUALT_Bualt19G0113300 [Buddleja alternifolia]|uniref:Uncharacterized protein n=1 Tax=Buddleja alternifolia TaxID=168488 RepID=A0AAV6WAF0_9LAMI|nr:hypothetical protein BUALT_Bualt19G0113300 [Buddleja alternifolia]
MSYLNIGMIKIMIKSTFRKGIDSPIKLALLDRRINNISDSLFGGIQGNLSYGKLMFTFSPKISVSLNDKHINEILCLAHEFARTDLMNEGDHPYSITYMLGYTISNSHHSMNFNANEPIRIDELFKNIGKISSTPVQDITPIQENWTMDLRRKPLLGSQPILQIEQNQNSGINNPILKEELDYDKPSKGLADLLPSTSENLFKKDIDDIAKKLSFLNDQIDEVYREMKSMEERFQRLEADQQLHFQEALDKASAVILAALHKEVQQEHQCALETSISFQKNSGFKQKCLLEHEQQMTI